MITHREKIAPIIVTLTVALILTIIPLPAFLIPMRPYWVALVVIFWCLETQDLVSLGSAFLLGVVLDILTGSLLGMHVLGLVILVYLVTRFRARLRFFPPWQQALSVLVRPCGPTGASRRTGDVGSPGAAVPSSARRALWPRGCKNHLPAMLTRLQPPP